MRALANCFIWLTVASTLVAPVAAQSVEKSVSETAIGLAQRPPMGWNSWNKFGCNVNEQVVRATANSIVTSGLRSAGYDYVIIDDCWQGGRNSNGEIVADAQKFPSGIKALADYVHSRGLKFGLYSDAGLRTCGGRSGSQGHEYQDALTYAGWGVDYLKYDWCNTGSRSPQEAYSLMADALRATGRPIVLSICEWGKSKPWLWGSSVGNLWRSTGDVTDSFDNSDPDKPWTMSLLEIVDANEPLWPFAGPGHWNDPDMLEVGNGGMSAGEYRAQLSLWAIMAAPLIAGNDVSKMDETTRSILLNKDVIAVDQDELGVQGHRVSREGEGETWVKPLENGARAVLLFNRGKVPLKIWVTADELGWPAKLRGTVRDLWRHESARRWTGSAEVLVQPHDVVMLRIDA